VEEQAQVLLDSQCINDGGCFPSPVRERVWVEGLRSNDRSVNPSPGAGAPLTLSPVGKR